MAASSEIDANFMSNMLSEQTFCEKQTSRYNFSNKTAPLVPAILDQDLSENVDHAGDTNHTNVKERNIYSTAITHREYDDDDDDKDDENRKRFIFVVVCGIAILALIGVGKCKEYTNLACSLQSSSNKGPSQIVEGGIVRDRKMFPHQVYLRIETISPYFIAMSLCGGSLISENFVLTVAHCVHNATPAGSKVLVGSLNKNNQNKTLWKAVKKFYIHPDADHTGANLAADIALIELEENVEFNSDIRPICLNTKLEEHYNSSIYATGWGLAGGNVTSDDLKMVEVPIHNEFDMYCEYVDKIIYSPEYVEWLRKTTICVAHVTGGGIEQGDSGGPLQVKLQSNCENIWEQIGITAAFFGEYKNKITIQRFVKVEYYIPWIVSVAWP